MSLSSLREPIPTPPGGGAEKKKSARAASPDASPAPFTVTTGFTDPLAASPFTTSYVPLQTVSTLSGASSHASVKQHSRAEVVARTVHLRCLPPFMKQREMAEVFDTCGEYLRVRICGNAATHQKWVYGFVEFATAEAAAAMLTHSGMELSNGPDKPPLRLKCSPSKQPILDCMAYDADVVSGTPCGFGRGYLAECTLNDALLVVGNGTTAPATGAEPTKPRSKKASAATRALTALTVTSIRKNAATGCGCGCAGVNCCGCCKCWKGGSEKAGDETQENTGKDGVTDSPSGCGCGDTCEAKAPVSESVEADSPYKSPLTIATAAVVVHPSSVGSVRTDGSVHHTVTSDTFAALAHEHTAMNAKEASMFDQLAAAFQGLRCSAAVQDGQLDGPAIVARAETMTLDALTRASHLSSDTRIQDILCDLAQLLGFLDANAAVTGGAAQTGSGDCTATLPQRVTQLRMLANLVGALLCLLRRSVADAVPYVEAVLVTFAQIPPSSLLLRARLYDKEVGKTKAPRRRSEEESGALFTVDVFGHSPPGGTESKSSHTEAGARLGRLSPDCAFIDPEVTDGLLTMMEEDEAEEDRKNAAAAGAATAATTTTAASLTHNTKARGGSDELSPEHTPSDNDSDDESAAAVIEQFLVDAAASSTTSSRSDESTAYMASADMADLCRREESFTRYVLNAVVAIGLAMESVHPVIARTAYTLANTRALEVLGEGSETVTKCLAASSTRPQLCKLLFQDAEKSGEVRDITFFPHRFFESVRTGRQRIRDARGTECFWRQLPPNLVVPLFKF